MNVLNKAIVKFVTLLPENVVFLFAKRYIAGTGLNDAVRVTKELNSKGILTTIDVLGEAITNEAEARAAQKKVIEVLETIDKENLNANISIKPTQMGLLIDPDLCYELVTEIVETAKRFGNFVRIDMEDSSTTDGIFELFKKLRKKYDNVGVVVQAYLRRSYDDVTELNALGTNYRLCKGIYIEPEGIAFKGRQEIRDNYLKLLEKMLNDGNYVGIATHDKYLIDKAYYFIKEKGIDKGNFEFQMLYGVTERMRDKINRDGYTIRIYVPFGEHWYPYSIRRLQENPNIAWYITKSIFSVR